ncbi:hypothetical protein MPC4_40150 [Methylocella tundrae]|uniref:Uncharacterized protein n=1 Tax=Methylocella tundrae TaxID=227605 RepID=A0A8B6M953_METTU|nr:hypothetical protein MPC4_40150 [Methylocella tundrae]
MESRPRAKKNGAAASEWGPDSHAAGGSARITIEHFAITLLNKQILIGLCARAFLFDPCRSGVQGKACYKVNGDSIRWDITLNPGVVHRPASMKTFRRNASLRQWIVAYLNSDLCQQFICVYLLRLFF